MVYRIRDFEIDEKNFELRHRGRAIPLQPKVFDVLLYLVERRDRVVGKAEIREGVWKHTTVSDGSVRRCVQALRRVWKECGENPQTIRTVHGRGYRFVAAPQDRFSSGSSSQNTPSGHEYSFIGESSTTLGDPGWSPSDS